MRWDNLTRETDERARLPGYREEAVVRHFDAPEAVSTRFYEVKAKSVLNRVPEASQMPFRWTINPYRGCSHACVYCLSGDTRVLTVDGGEKALRDLRVGDRIYGTRREGRSRRYVESEVLDTWSSIKPAYRLELADGTELVGSAEHRLLTARGWKHLIGAEQGRLRRPHLSVGSRLLGPGGSTPAPAHDRDYRLGYLSGMIRGDGALARYPDERPRRPVGEVYRFRLARADDEALLRATAFLDLESLATTRFEFLAASGSHRTMAAVRSQSRASFERISELIEWPLLPSLSWVKGFLAGIFDAEGSCSRGVARISNTDERILSWTAACLARLGFESAVERRTGAAATIRIRGGLTARNRFLLLTDPAITRKRSITGSAVESANGLDIASIEPLGETMRMYDITTVTGDFIANGVISHNCFARPTHTYLDFDAGRDFEREIVVKVNAPEVLRAELARPSWKREHVALGTNTDPYQWVEGRYRLMPAIWEALLEAANPCSILTKSPLLLRDLELMRALSEITEFGAALSIPTLEERAWRATEPHTPNPNARIEAVAELARAGIRTGVLIAPLMPGINDSPEQVAEIVERVTEAGAAYVSGIALHLRREVRGLFFDWLEQQRPDLSERYGRLYRRGAYAPPEERRRLARLVKGPDLPPGERMRGTIREVPAERPRMREVAQQKLF